MVLKGLLLLIAVSGVGCHQRKGCCLPEKWQLRQHIWRTSIRQNGSMQVVSGFIEEFVDGPGQRIRQNRNIGSEKLDIIMLFKENVAYTIENGTCKKDKPGPWFNKTICTPENSSVSSPYSVGYKPHITVVDYSREETVMGMAENCVPIFFNQKDTQIAMTSLFQDFSPEIKDSGVFHVPAICKRAKQMFGELSMPWYRGLLSGFLLNI